MARKKSVEIELDLQDRDAKKALKDITKEIGKTEDAFEDAESAGKQMARAIQRSADDMIDEIDATKRAVDEMERALDGTDMDPREVVADLKSIGLTAQDIELDAEELATALKRAGEVKTHATKQGFDDVGQAVGSVRDETGRAKDTMHGFVGGAVGELPLIGDAMGPVAEGLGQLTEGALAGEISMRDMAKVVGPMAGLTAAVMLLQKGMESVAATKAFNEKQAEDFADAIKEVGEGVEAVNKVLEETDEIVGRAGGTFGAFEKEIDIAPTLRRAGVSYDQWLDAVANGGPALDLVTERLTSHRDAMEEARNEAQRNGETTVEYERAISDANNAVEIAEETHKNYSGELANTAEHEEWKAESTIRSTEATEAAIEATDKAIEAHEEQAEALRDATEALEEQLDAQLEAADASYALEQAQFDLIDAVEEANEIFGEAEQGSREYREAELAVIDAANGVAQAEIRKAEETAAASGKTLTATQRVDAMNSSLLNQAATLNGPARQALLNHIAKVNDIPASKMTAINAAIDRGDLAEAERLINGASRARTSAVGVDLNRSQEQDVERRLNNLARWRGTGIDINTRVRGRGNARGTSYWGGGPTLVGEEGPEIADLPMGTAVTDAQKSKGVMARMGGPRGGGGGGNVTNYITQNFPAGARPTDVKDAQRRWTKRNGPV